ncbi:hypothetical protein BKA93DRAFT_271380 [Sparassis latifolia]
MSNSQAHTEVGVLSDRARDVDSGRQGWDQLLALPGPPTAGPPPVSRSPPTDYGVFVVNMLGRMTRTGGTIDQRVLRRCLGLSSSYLITDTTMNAEHGLNSWHTGFGRLIDVVVALHARGELEVETISKASKSCSECWTVAGLWKETDGSRESVKGVAIRLKELLDGGGKTYRGVRIYAP